MKGGAMERYVSEDLAVLAALQPGFDELKAWPSEFGITAAMWPVMSQRVKDALQADLTEAGYDWTTVRAVEYRDGKLFTVTVLIRQR